jgi:hypothetical protein
MDTCSRPLRAIKAMPPPSVTPSNIRGSVDAPSACAATAGKIANEIQKITHVSHTLVNFAATTASALAGVVNKAPSVPARRSSARQRIVNRGKMHKRGRGNQRKTASVGVHGIGVRLQARIAYQ